MRRLDLRLEKPPPEWGVTVDFQALAQLARRWSRRDFPLPRWDYTGLPRDLEPTAWSDYCLVAVSVMACLWPPDDEAVWGIEYEGEWLTDAPALFACFSRGLRRTKGGWDWTPFLSWSDADAEEFFRGRGRLQLVSERRALLTEIVEILVGHWGGRSMHLLEEARFDGPTLVDQLAGDLPGYRDEATTEVGVLAFNKRAYLAVAMMASGTSGTPIDRIDSFPVYADYILPMVLRHHGVLVYEEPLADAVDSRQLIPSGHRWENAIRWATIHAAEQLRLALAEHGRSVATPVLDFFLWSEGVLGPVSGTHGEHHRTPGLAY